MAITKSTKDLSADKISCGGSFEVVLTLGAEPDIASNPTDIVLILDRSGSMTRSQEAVLRFTATHLGLCQGLLPVNESIDYQDDQDQTPDFGDPRIQVDCGGVVVIPEPCPEPVDVVLEGCETELEFDAGEVSLESLGRILKLDVTIPNVCPGRRVALAVILTEVDHRCNEYRRGMKTLVIPAHYESGCRNVTVRCIRFVLPELLDVSGDPDRLCDERRFKARFLANYIDAGFTCCTRDA